MLTTSIRILVKQWNSLTFVKEKIVMEDKDNNPETSRSQSGAYVAFGIIIGAAMGAIMDNLALGVALGIVIGAVITAMKR